MKPEEEARIDIDHLLEQAGWVIQYIEEKPVITMVAGGLGIALIFTIWKVLFGMR